VGGVGGRDGDVGAADRLLGAVAGKDFRLEPAGEALAVLLRGRKDPHLPDRRAHAQQPLDLRRGLLARSEDAENLRVLAGEVLGRHRGRGADAQCGHGVVVHDPEELVGGAIPQQHEAGEVPAELQPLDAVLHGLGHVRRIEAHRDHALAGDGAGDDVEHGPARLGAARQRAMDAPARQDLHLRVAERGFDRLDRLCHRHQALRVLAGEDEGGLRHRYSI
jgi:hypothetical protein